MDAYGILGLKRGVSQEEVKKAYRRASLKYHPDRNHGNEAAERLFRLIKSAYESLCNNGDHNHVSGNNIKQNYDYVASREKIIRHYETCEFCRGTGQEKGLIFSRPCRKCKGTGKICYLKPGKGWKFCPDCGCSGVDHDDPFGSLSGPSIFNMPCRRCGGKRVVPLFGNVCSHCHGTGILV